MNFRTRTWRNFAGMQIATDRYVEHARVRTVQYFASEVTGSVRIVWMDVCNFSQGSQTIVGMHHYVNRSWS